MKTAKRFCILILVMNMMFLSGCWNYHELEDMSLVTGVAIDKGIKGCPYHLTFEFIDLTGDKIGSKLVESDGNTIYDCVRNIANKAEKKLNFSECKVIIISQDSASQGIAPLMDWFIRDHEPRINVNLIVSKEKTANEILQQKPVTDELISLEIWKTLQRNVTSLGKSPNVELYQAINMLSDNGTALVLPTIKIDKLPTSTTLALDGSAVFKGDKLIGYLDGEETKYLLLIKNQNHGGLLIVNTDTGKVTLEIIDSSTKLTPKVESNQPSMEIEIKTRAILSEDEALTDHDSSNGIKEVQKNAEDTLKNNVTDLIKTVQSQTDSDIFGFGSLYYQNNPEFWKQEKLKWKDDFRKLKCIVNVKVKIENTEVIKQKVKVGG
ncbi:Ger(x)C family spore germination protein [Caproiciproducens galactitolivorans]|uniref:Ger(X)C family spore germination protein n=1 Tax=Caproiciproducens galactitolivorans TaxID=642589 RepID=A0ABT4BRF9_9FIRM|nr:Ger(x)C family spore germination protein [Caproiciproducens galactitolivorans]MCY1713482.1 Ger(x)C family spore germination protein [Caproiciproducens galactitolivorans]